MGILRLQHCFQGQGGTAEDRYCNTWHLSTTATLTPEIPEVGQNIRYAFTTFYEGIMDTYGSNNIEYSGETYKIYALEDTLPRTPRYQWINVSTPANAGAASLALPNEVAMCLSFEAVAVTGTNRARRRGRVYLGPFASNAIADDAAYSRPHADLMTAVIAQYEDLYTTLAGLTPAVSLGIYSPTDALFLPARHAWVDDAWDTVRRRGIDPTRREETFVGG